MTATGSPETFEMVRPLRLGLSIGHPAGSEGTLGPFVTLASGRPGFLSAAHVLAPRGATRGDLIHQPGPIHRLPTGETRIGVFIRAISEESESTPMLPGIAIAELLDGISAVGNCLPEGAPGQGRFISGAIDAADLELGDEVALIGRTSGIRLGTIDGLAMAGLQVQTPAGDFGIPTTFSILGRDSEFSAPGDAGGLVYRTRDLAAIGLLFAADPPGDTPRSYALPLAPALRELGAQLLAGSLAATSAEPVAAG